MFFLLQNCCFYPILVHGTTIDSFIRGTLPQREVSVASISLGVLWEASYGTLRATFVLCINYETVEDGVDGHVGVCEEQRHETKKRTPSTGRRKWEYGTDGTDRDSSSGLV